MQFILTVLLALLGGVSSACLSNCIECTNNSNTCVQCDNGYFLASNTGECYQCSSHCNECTSLSSCTSCQSGYNLNNGYCNQCSWPCLSCSSSRCISCASGYYLNNGSCNQCSSPCLSCASSRCTSCASGYYLDNGSCSQCSWPCLSCASSRCTSCESGYYLDNGYCTQCSWPCHECTSTSFCTSCKSGYYLKNGYCNLCSWPCLSCASSRLNTTGDCESCPQKFFLRDGICIACDPYCASCNNATGICDKCVPGYYGKFCQYRCDDLCNRSKCEAVSGKCIDGCRFGYYQLGNKCALCPSNCLSCQNSSRCITCTTDKHLETLADGSVVCSLRDDMCSACIDAHCCSQEYSLKATTAGIVAMTFPVGLFAGMLLLYAIQVLLRARHRVTQSGSPLTGNHEFPVPTVYYLNSKRLNNNFEVPDSPSTSEVFQTDLTRDTIPILPNLLKKSDFNSV